MAQTKRSEELYDRTWLEKARKIAGLRQYEVAENAGISQAFYNRIETGVQTPNVKIGVAIANVLGFSPNMWIDERKIA
jgi:transcriptional regulator with XRE-family HTH domain